MDTLGPRGDINSFPRRRAFLHREVLLVLGVSLGASALYSLVRIIDRLSRPERLSEQTSALNVARYDRPWLDLTYQLLDIGLALVPAALALHLLAAGGRSPWRMIGLDLNRPWFDAWTGVGLAALIGLPGLGLYVVSRELGINTTVAAANLGEHWWTVPVLVLSAGENGLLEEIVVVGYLMTRLAELRYHPVAIIAVSALLRGSYHLYQGFGGFVGNAVMGVVFALFFIRFKRVAPLVVAHTILDIVSFVGYALLADHVGWL